MDEGIFIVIALAICLALLASLFFVIDRLGDRVFTLVAQARAREQNDIINHQRLARTLNELVDETTVLTGALKSERILRSHAEAVGRVAEKKATRATPVAPPDPGAGGAGSKRTDVTEASTAAAKSSVPEPSDDAETRVLARPDLQAATRPAARLTPTRLSAPSAPWALNELVDEMTVLADALKNERILRSHTEATGRVAAKKAARADVSVLDPAAPARDDRKAEETWPPVHTEAGRAESPSDDDATCVLVKPEIPVTPGKTTARLTPTRVSVDIHTQGGQP